MKLNRRFYTALLFILCAFWCSNSTAQTCTAAFVYTMGPAGTTSFISVSSVSGTPTYYWNFGNGTPVYTTGSTTAVGNYSANGVYNVTLTVITATPNCISSVVQTITITTVAPPPTCSLNINFTPPNPPNACNGSATIVSVTGACSLPTYTWSTGATGSIVTGLCQGFNYTATAVSSGSGNCCPLITQSLSIPTTSCSINAGFQYAVLSPGVVSFSSTTTGTVPGTTFSWNYGDGSPFGSGPVVSHTFSTSGQHLVKLFANNNFTTTTCIDSSFNFVSVTVPCSLNVSFAASVNSNSVSFVSTSTGTISSSSYTWNFGDGGTAYVNPTSYIYPANGIYNVTLNVSRDSSCASSAVKQVTISNAPCGISNVAYTHTVVAPGLVNFTGSASGIGLLRLYRWDFGDGVYGLGNTASHTYLYGGAYNVKLVVQDSLNLSCRDSIVYSLNITGLPCSANAGFNLIPTNTPQYWNATPFYPWNVTNARWSWGDGSSDTLLYTSHIYASAGTYSICLSVTVSCGAADSTCSPYSVFRSSGMQQDAQMIYVNVMRPALVDAIAAAESESPACNIYPNPGQGNFTVDLSGIHSKKISLLVYNSVGGIVYEAEVETNNGSLQKNISLEGVANGLYFTRIGAGNQLLTKKIIINK